jgi:hypothetical protein
MEQAKDQNTPQGQVTLKQIMHQLQEIAESQAQDVASMLTLRTQTEELRAYIIAAAARTTGTPPAIPAPTLTPTPTTTPANNVATEHPRNPPIQRKPLAMGTPFSSNKTYFQA